MPDPTSSSLGFRRMQEALNLRSARPGSAGYHHTASSCLTLFRAPETKSLILNVLKLHPGQTSQPARFSPRPWLTTRLRGLLIPYLLTCILAAHNLLPPSRFRKSHNPFGYLRLITPISLSPGDVLSHQKLRSRPCLHHANHINNSYRRPRLILLHLDPYPLLDNCYCIARP